jgi:hypothetical protein
MVIWNYFVLIASTKSLRRPCLQCIAVLLSLRGPVRVRSEHQCLVGVIYSSEFTTSALFWFTHKKHSWRVSQCLNCILKRSTGPNTISVVYMSYSSKCSPSALSRSSHQKYGWHILQLRMFSFSAHSFLTPEVWLAYFTTQNVLLQRSAAPHTRSMVGIFYNSECSPSALSRSSHQKYGWHILQLRMLSFSAQPLLTPEVWLAYFTTQNVLLQRSAVPHTRVYLRVLYGSETCKGVKF